MVWNDLTDRQKQLDSLIDNCDVQLDATNGRVEKVARAIGQQVVNWALCSND